MISDNLFYRTHNSNRHNLYTAFLYLLPPFLLFLRITIFQRGRSVDNFATVDTYASAQILIVGIIWVILFITPRFMLLVRKLSGTSVGILMLFYVFCSISAIWSPFKAYTLYRAFEITGVCLIIFLAIDCIDDFIQAEKLVLGFSSLLLFIFLLRFCFTKSHKEDMK